MTELQMNLQKGLVGHWTMDDADTSGGTLYDRSAYDNHGTLVNTPTTGTASILGEAYSFENTNGEWVDIDNSVQSLVDGIPDATISMFVKVPNNTAVDGGDTGLLSFCGSSANNNHYPWTDGFIYCNVFKDNRINFDNTGFDKTNWHRLTIINESGQSWRLYQNNTLSHTATAETSVTFNVDAAIGRNVTGNNNFDGEVSDVRLYNRAITEEEINALYNMRSPRYANI